MTIFYTMKITEGLSNLIPSAVGILLGLSSFLFSFLTPLSILSLVTGVSAIGLCGFSLEKSGRAKLLPIIGLVLGALGFIWSILVHSNLPNNGYSM
ncbi:MAG: hypothetical protein MUO85_03375 [candidate division Zixibacteria bacterium]|nr:hypothetical protein [candidate division Zixibacteria bacterium]